MIDRADPVELARALIRCPSVTPEDGGAIDVLVEALEPLGFACHSLVFEEEGAAPVANLYARLGSAAPNLAFAGHTDVVPPGDLAAWSVDPFAGEVRDGVLYGRGACDMKGGIAAFLAAVARHLREHGPPRGSISLLITGDEEGPAVNGTKKLLAWAAARGERLDACIVGEPTSLSRVGEMVKIGRRGSLCGWLTVEGVQGHTAYPGQADNPVPRLLAMLRAISAEPLDAGNAHFQPSDLQITSIDVGNPTPNVIPARARAAFNIRFNDEHTAASLEARLRECLAGVGGRFNLEIDVGGEAFLTPPGPLVDMVVAAVREVQDTEPVLGTSGGTSDARFVKDYCPVVEFGAVGLSMHRVDEHVLTADLEALTEIYRAILRRYFR